MILTADIGGTKIILAVAAPGKNGIELTALRLFETGRHQSFDEVIELYLAEHPALKISSACLAVAGPVLDNRCKMTNVVMEIDAESIAQRLDIGRVVLLNDLAASGYGLEVISPDALEIIQRGKAGVNGNRILVSPGTGLGESIVHYVGGRSIPIASEGGHADFAPFNGVTNRLWSFLKKTLPRVAVEDVLSGPGIYNIYRFMISEYGGNQDERVETEKSGKSGRMISNLAIKENDSIASETIRLFLDILAAEAGNMALKALPAGGVYLGGGIIPHLSPLLDRARFRAIYSSKGHHRPILEKFPIHIVKDTNLPLYGAANHMISSETV